MSYKKISCLSVWKSICLTGTCNWNITCQVDKWIQIYLSISKMTCPGLASVQAILWALPFICVLLYCCPDLSKLLSQVYSDGSGNLGSLGSNKVFFLVQVRLGTEVLCTPSSTWQGFELMTSRSWQYISCHWAACSNHSAITTIANCALGTTLQNSLPGKR